MSEWIECPKCGVMYKGEHTCPKKATNEREELLKRLRHAALFLPRFKVKWEDIEKMPTSELKEIVEQIDKQVATATKKGVYGSS